MSDVPSRRDPRGFGLRAAIAFGLSALVLCVSATALATPASPKLVSCSGRALSHVYWDTATRTGFVVRKVPVSGGKVTLIAKDNAYGQWPRRGPALAVDCTHVYWASDSTLQSVPIGGGKRTTLTDVALGDAGAPLVVDHTNVYWGAATAT